MLVGLVHHADFDFQGFPSHVLLREDDLERLDPLQNLDSAKACYCLTLLKLHLDQDLLRHLIIYHELLAKLALTGTKQPLYI